MDHLYDASVVLEDVFSMSGIPPVVKRLNSRGWSAMRNFSQGPALSIGLFPKAYMK